MFPVTLAGLPKGLNNVLKTLERLETAAENGDYSRRSREIDWSLQRKANPREVRKFWSHCALNNMDYAENIKEYAEIHPFHQTFQFKNNYYVFSWLPFVYKAYEMEADGIPLGDGTYLPAREEDYDHLPEEYKKLYSKIGYRLMTEVVAKMKDINLTREEYLLLRATALMIPGDCLPDNIHSKVLDVNIKLQTALSEIREGSLDVFFTAIEGILKSLADIGIYETFELVNLFPNEALHELLRQRAPCPV